MKQILLIVLLVYVIILVVVYFQQKKFIFYPTKTEHSVEHPNITDYSISTNNTTLKGWLVNEKALDQGVIIYYGGNAEDIFYTIEQLQSFDLASLLVNYRGYGSSRGEPGEKELFADALAIYDDVKATYSPQKIFLMGRSLGSGVATYVASRREVAGAILITPFDSLETLAHSQFPFLPTSLLLQHKFRSVDYVRNITAPMLIIYGGKDRIVPPSCTETLLDNIKTHNRIIFIETAEHNNIELFPEYELAILQFVHSSSM